MGSMSERRKDLDDLLSELGVGEEPPAQPDWEEEAPSAATPKTPEEVVEHFLVGLLLYLDPAYTLEIKSDDQRIYIEVMGGDLGRLIGKDGRTLKALETLTNSVLTKHFGHRYRAVVDAAGYRRRRARRAVDLAHKAAEQAEATGEPVPLPPMSPAERREVHIALKDHPGVYTESQGEGEERHVVVYPVGEDQG